MQRQRRFSEAVEGKSNSSFREEDRFTKYIASAHLLGRLDVKLRFIDINSANYSPLCS
jgi:hypothetical protein